MNLLRLNTSIALACFVMCILFYGCKKPHETISLYQCSKDMIDGYRFNYIYIDTLSKDTLVFETPDNFYYVNPLSKDTVKRTIVTADNYYEGEEKYEGEGYHVIFDVERYKSLMSSNSIIIEYFLKIEIWDRSTGGHSYEFFDGLEINLHTSTSNTNPLRVIIADQFEETNTDCSNVDAGVYIGKSGDPSYTNHVEDYIQFTYYDSIALNNIFFYKVYFKETGSNSTNTYSIYFTKDEGIIAFKTPDNKFYMQQQV